MRQIFLLVGFKVFAKDKSQKWVLTFATSGGGVGGGGRDGRVERQISTARERMRKMEIDIAQKEDLKTVALGTSKINYMDPRISIAWCKRHEVPLEKV